MIFQTSLGNTVKLMCRVFFVGIVLATESFAASRTEAINQLLKSIAELDENHGTAVSLGASALAGANLQLEAVNVKGNLAFYCAAGVSAKLEDHAYAGVGMHRLDIRGCDTPDMYEGAFLTLMVSGGLDAIVNPSLDFSVSYGMNYVYLRDSIEQRVLRGYATISALLVEAFELNMCLSTMAVPAAKFLFSMTELAVKSIHQVLKEELEKNRLSLSMEQIQDLRVKLRTLENLIIEQRSRTIAQNAAGQGSCKAESLAKSFSDYDTLLRFTSAQIQPLNMASVLPSKAQLGYIAQRLLDSKNFPLLRTLILEIVERDMSGCDATSVGVSAGISTGSVISASVGFGLSNYKKVGPTVPIKAFQTKYIDRYVSYGGFSNLKFDAYSGMIKTCEKVHGIAKCTWEAVCYAVQNPKQARDAGFKGARVLCDSSKQALVKLLNVAEECTLGNFKAIEVDKAAKKLMNLLDFSHQSKPQPSGRVPTHPSGFYKGGIEGISQ